MWEKQYFKLNIRLVYVCVRVYICVLVLYNVLAYNITKLYIILLKPDSVAEPHNRTSYTKQAVYYNLVGGL